MTMADLGSQSYNYSKQKCFIKAASNKKTTNKVSDCKAE